jgi:hypothetical protein
VAGHPAKALHQEELAGRATQGLDET